MVGRRGRDIIRDYPEEWPRKLDLLPLLGLQAAVDDALELYYCEAMASVREGKKIPHREVKTEFGTITAHPEMRNTILYEKGTLNLRDGVEPVSQRELLNDITESLPIVLLPGTKIPDVVMRERGMVEGIPKKVENMKQLQGAENIFSHQTAYGIRSKWMRRTFGIGGLANPYDLIKSDLLYYDIIKSPKPIQLKLRSTLKTRYITTDTAGWGNFDGPSVLQLEQALSEEKWWQDIGIPTSFQVDGVQGLIYYLARRNRLTVI